MKLKSLELLAAKSVPPKLFGRVDELGSAPLQVVLRKSHQISRLEAVDWELTQWFAVRKYGVPDRP